MKRVITALILAPLVLALVFLGPKWLITLAVAAVAMLAAWEFLALTEHRGAKPPRIAVVVAIAALFFGNYHWPDETVTLFGLLCILLLIYCTFRSAIERALADATSSIFALFYLGLTLIPLPMLREATNGPSLLVFLFLTVWAGDTVAMYTGRCLRETQVGSQTQPKQDVGRFDRLSGWVGCGCGDSAGFEFLAGVLQLREVELLR